MRNQDRDQWVLSEVKVDPLKERTITRVGRRSKPHKPFTRLQHLICRFARAGLHHPAPHFFPSLSLWNHIFLYLEWRGMLNHPTCSTPLLPQTSSCRFIRRSLRTKSIMTSSTIPLARCWVSMKYARRTPQMFPVACKSMEMRWSAPSKKISRLQ